jgi:hypothetical protein
MFGRLIGWFKVRFVFTDEQLMDAVDMLDRVDRKKLNDEKLWKKAQDARAYIIRELIRREHYDYIA